MKHILLPLLLLISAVAAGYAQPSVVSITPGKYAKDASTNATIVITWSEAIDQGTVDHTSVLVRGSQTGPRYADAGTVFSFPTATSASFTVSEPFKAGEQITVQLRHTIANTSGTQMATDYTHYFFAQTQGQGPRIFTEYNEVHATSAELRWVGAADFNNDGRNDIVYSSMGGSIGYTVLLQQLDGSFSTSQNITTTQFVGFFAVADLNGDGFLDIAGGKEGFPDINIMLNNGDGTFGLSAATTVRAADKIVAEDVNGDGFLDLVYEPVINFGIYYVPGNGDGTFDAEQTIAGGSTDYDVMQVGDIDGDGLVDIISSTTTNAGVNFMGDGVGGFSEQFTGGTYSTKEMRSFFQLTEFNGDGAPDLLYNRAVTGSAHALSLITSPGYDAETPLFAGVFNSGSSLNPLCAADIDANGTIDIVGIESYSNIAMFSNDGTGVFTLSSCATTAPQVFNRAACMADMNGDGSVDYVLGSWLISYEGISIFYNTPQPPSLSFSAPSVSVGVAVLGTPRTTTASVVFQALTEDITVATSSADFSVSADSVLFGTTATLLYAAGSPRTLYIRFDATTTGSTSAVVTAFSSGVSTTLTVSADGIAPGTVVNTLDSGPGSLRYALESATSGTVITFAGGATSGFFSLSGGPIVISHRLSIDFSSIVPDGIIIDSGVHPALLFECGGLGTNLVGIRIEGNDPNNAVISNCQGLRPVKVQNKEQGGLPPG